MDTATVYEVKTCSPATNHKDRILALVAEKKDFSHKKKVHFGLTKREQALAGRDTLDACKSKGAAQVNTTNTPTKLH